MTHGASPSPSRRMCPRFFVVAAERAEGVAAAGVELSLPPRDAYHAAHVLRLRPGDPCEVVIEPSRVLFSALVTRATDAQVEVRLGEVITVAGGGLWVTLIQALPELRSVDVIVAKGTEVGVDEFILVPAEGSPRVQEDRLDARLERWSKVALEAAKQSKQLAVPHVLVSSLEQARAYASGAGWASVVLEPSAPDGLEEVLARLGPVGRLALWVGPEGGWTEDELAVLAGHGSDLARLGRRILRAETAGPVAAAVVRYALRDW
jgi:16S rRNA (uracil1498-N3)-methyltransferase